MKKYIVPAILSATVCPGLGQMVKGQVFKGILILLALAVGLFATVVIAVLTSIEVGIVLSACLVGLYLWNIFDAYSHIPRGLGS
jgi:TM2 domain-containing membrane protein YozV